ncbi:EXOSTOSIN FAMILY PROTEIN [Salix viminalis]|uniref:EXOSTOSIN FAMILY PROTEIN n=1 Tax=Salix viminalis TaxID=40686 RepID=A0A9Q0SC92_SALVM|nr:EXOSTOSIN FAMILY PROTEIN [Salix viminalis]
MTLLVPATVPRGKGLKGAIIMGAFFWIDIRLQGHEDQELVFGKPVGSITAMDFLSNLNFPKAAPESSSFLPAVSPQAMPSSRIDLVLSCAIHALKSELIENPEFDDLGWLYETKPERLPRNDYTEIYRAGTDRLSRPISSLFPTPQYLSQAEIYALPFTIPF